MPDQFKVGDIVRLSDEALVSLGRLARIFGESPLRVCPADVDGCKPGVVCFQAVFGGPVESCNADWLVKYDLLAEEARLKSLLAQVQHLKNAQAQGDGLSRLRSIVGETGYFKSADTFYRYRESGGITEDDMITGYYSVAVADGYVLAVYGGGEVEASPAKVCSCFPSDLEGWESITKERFEKARADYESIVENVKEAMKP